MGRQAFRPAEGRRPGGRQGLFQREGRDIVDEDGFFDTGDVATIDPDGYMQITDRAKDVIKSGGEWISSIDIENLAVGHPDIAEAAVIGVAHPKWDERPLLIVVPKEGKHPQPAEVLGYLEGRIAAGAGAMAAVGVAPAGMARVARYAIKLRRLSASGTGIGMRVPGTTVVGLARKRSKVAESQTSPDSTIALV